MLTRENHLLGYTRSNPSQSSVPSDLALASDFGFCFQCQAGSSLVLRRPIKITALTRRYCLDSETSPSSGLRHDIRTIPRFVRWIDGCGAKLFG